MNDLNKKVKLLSEVSLFIDHATKPRSERLLIVAVHEPSKLANLLLAQVSLTK